MQFIFDSFHFSGSGYTCDSITLRYTAQPQAYEYSIIHWKKNVYGLLREIESMKLQLIFSVD